MSSLTGSMEPLKEVISQMNLTDTQLQFIDSKWHLGLSSSSNTPHCFMTINLPKQNDPKVNYDLVLSLVPRISCLHGAEAVMEFHPMPHCHILFLRPQNFRKANLIRSVVRALQLDRPELVDILVSSKANDYQNRKNYLRGNKASAEKTERVLADKQIREDNEIPHLIFL